MFHIYNPITLSSNLLLNENNSIPSVDIKLFSNSCFIAYIDKHDFPTPIFYKIYFLEI